MAENEVDLRELYIKWCEDETRNKFDREDLPAGVVLAVGLMEELDPLEFDVVSEKLSDMSQTYATNEDGIPLKVMRWLRPYYRLRSL